MNKFLKAVDNFFFADDDLEDYQTPKKKTKVNESTPIKEDHFVPIDLNAPRKEDKPIVKPAKPIEKPEPVKEKVKNPSYQFTQVISPVFGLKDEQGNNYHPAVLTTPKTNKKSPLGTIISPVHGLMEEEINRQEVPDELASLNVSDLLEETKEESNIERVIEHKSSLPENLSFFDQEEQ